MKKNTVTRRLLCLLLVLMMALSLLPVSALAAGNTEWAGVMNMNSANNQVTSTALPTDSDTTYLKWSYALNTTAGSWGSYYAGQTVIIDDYLYATGGGKLHKVDTETGSAAASLENIGTSSYTFDFLSYDKDDGLLFVCESNAIKAIDLTSFTLVGSLTGLSLGAYHPIQYHDGYLYCNGNVFSVSYSGGSCTIKLYDTIDGSYNWSSGAFVTATEGTYSGKDIFYIASKTALSAYDTASKTVIASWDYSADSAVNAAANYGAGVAYSGGRLYWGYYKSSTAMTGGYLFSIPVNADGTLDNANKIVKESVQPTVCTPVISGGRLYLAGQSGQVSVFSADTLDLIYSAAANDLYSKTSGKYDGGIAKIQSTPILYTTGDGAGTSYLYFQTYNAPGYIYYLKDDATATSGTLQRLATPNQGKPTDSAGAFAMEQIATDDEGCIYCYNELGYLFCFAQTDVYLASLSSDVGVWSDSFTPQREDYELVVPVGTKSISFDFAANAGCTVKVNSLSNSTGAVEYEPDFSSGADTVSIKVSAGDSSRTYTVSIRQKLTSTAISYGTSTSNSAPSSQTSLTNGTIISAAANTRFWVTAPENGSVSYEVVQGAAPTIVSSGLASPYVLRFLTKDVSKQLVLRLTATAEDGVTTQVYYVVLSSDGSYTPVTADVNVTIANAGALVTGTSSTLLAMAPVTASDRNYDCEIDVDEALYAAHETYYNGGAAAGYGTEATSYGLSLTKLWGDTSGCFGYYVDDASCWSLANTIEAGSNVTAFIYADKSNWSDSYAFFDNAKDSAVKNTPKTLTLNSYSYDADWNLVPIACADASVQYSSDGGSTWSDALTTDASGQISVTFASAGEYIVKAYKADNSIVPAVCRVTVCDAFANTVVTAPLADASDYLTGIYAADSYSVSQENGVYKLSATDLKYHLGDSGYGYWTGIGVEIPDGATYENIKYSFTTASISGMESAGMTAADFTTDGKEYMSVYWDASKYETDTVYVSFDGINVYGFTVNFSGVKLDEADSAAITFSAANAGVFLTDKDGAEMVARPLTAFDYDYDGKITVDEALTAAHDEYYTAGISGYSVGSSWASKFWGTSTYALSFYVDNISIPMGVTIDTVNEGAHLYGFIFADDEYYSDIYAYFKSASVTATAGSAVSLPLSYDSFALAVTPESTNITYAVYKEGVLADSSDYSVNGEEFTFSSAGSYKVYASGSIDFGKAPSTMTGVITPAVCTVVVSDYTPPVSSNITVTFSLLGDSAHGDDGSVHTLSGGDLTTWISPRSVSTTSTSTVGAVFKSVLDSAGYTYAGLENNYISSITNTSRVTLSATTNGANSGWMYTVNGVYPDVGLNSYTLSSGDVIIFHYTDDYIKEQWGGTVTPDEKPDAELPFNDVSGHWALDSIKWASEQGLMDGVGGGSFDPEGQITRAMTVCLLYRLAEKPAVTGSSPFDDVEPGSWYADAVIWASQNGITSGVGGGLYGVNDAMTREQLAAMLFAYAKYMKYDTTKASDISGYGDAALVSDWAVEGMRWANAEGLVTGRTDDTLVPGGDGTRAELASLIQRFCESFVK